MYISCSCLWTLFSLKRERNQSSLQPVLNSSMYCLNSNILKKKSAACLAEQCTDVILTWLGLTIDKRTFNNYVDRTLPFFDPCVDSFYTMKVDKIDIF